MLSLEAAMELHLMPPAWRPALERLREATIPTALVPTILPKFDSHEARVLFWYAASKALS